MDINFFSWSSGMGQMFNNISKMAFVLVFVAALLGTVASVIALQGDTSAHSGNFIAPQKTYVHSRLNTYLTAQRYTCVLLDDYVCMEKQ